tara:strand:- start:204 stop:800 length:597 start_codon:yes stop_codon:yes gene_type:complete
MLAFNQAKTLTYRMIDWFNSANSDAYLHGISQRFNLKIKDDFTVRINSIGMNCSECNVNGHGERIAGCYHEDKKSICYLDKALTHRPIGKKLIYHEMGHAIYDQVFNDGLSPEESFLKSEEVATHIENTFPEFLEENLMIHHSVFGADTGDEVRSLAFSAKDTIVKGLLWGLAFTTGAILMSSILDKKKTKKFFEAGD